MVDRVNLQERYDYPYGVIAATLFTLVALGHDGRRLAQMMALALPALAWLLWPVSSSQVHRLRTGCVWLWVMGFAIDGVVRAYLLDTYQAAPNSSFILTAAANTNERETSEYLSMYWRTMLVGYGALLIAGLVVGRYAGRGARAETVLPRRAVALLCAVTLLLGSVGYLSKPWRRLHPALFWTQWSESVNALRTGWADQQQVRKRALARAFSAAPTMAQKGPATVVLVITDSVNRDNLALYGYERATTPRLLAQKAQLQNEMLVLRNAWSVDASTLPSLRNMFLFGQAPTEDPQHVLALARAAGYKVWWISNHDDVSIEQQHGRLAYVFISVNRTPGRAGASLDGELLGDVRLALEDMADRKLIVVHLMGAHPQYSLRFPRGANPFDDRVDDVEEGLKNEGRSAWVRLLRHEYDAALLYQDFVVSETLQLTRKVGHADGYRAWLYLSDHGQEVGHVGNHAGHSRSTESGYRIPTVIWHNSETEVYRPETGDRPFRADWAGWTIADLLNIRWTDDATDRNLLADNYRWQAPALPVQVQSFRD